jgi:hypothetical protein
MNNDPPDEPRGPDISGIRPQDMDLSDVGSRARDRQMDMQGDMSDQFADRTGLQQTPLNQAEKLIRLKHAEYTRASAFYRVLYYAVRLIAGLCAGLLPFVVSTHVQIATGLSIAVVVATVLDMVFNPKDRWQLYSRATDLLTVEQLKRQGNFADYQSLIAVLVTTETAKLERLVNMDDLLNRIRQSSRRGR